MEQKENKSTTSQFLKTDGGKTKSNAIEVPSISLPKGGGTIKGIDEKFSVNTTVWYCIFFYSTSFLFIKRSIPFTYGSI